MIPKLDYKSTTCLLSTITVGSVGACLQYGGRMPTVSVTTRGNMSFFLKTIWRRSGGGEHRGRRVNGATQIEQVRDRGVVPGPSILPDLADMGVMSEGRTFRPMSSHVRTSAAGGISRSGP